MFRIPTVVSYQQNLIQITNCMQTWEYCSHQLLRINQSMSYKLLPTLVIIEVWFYSETFFATAAQKTVPLIVAIRLGKSSLVANYRGGTQWNAIVKMRKSIISSDRINAFAYFSATKTWLPKVWVNWCEKVADNYHIRYVFIVTK